jgi:16S rRNA processing protein RimM
LPDKKSALTKPKANAPAAKPAPAKKAPPAARREAPPAAKKAPVKAAAPKKAAPAPKAAPPVKSAAKAPPPAKTAAKPAPKPAPAAAAKKPEPKPAPKADEKVKAAAKTAKPEVKAAKPAPKAEAKARPEAAKPDPKAKAKPEAKAKVEAKVEAKKPAAKVKPPAEPKPAPAPKVKAEKPPKAPKPPKPPKPPKLAPVAAALAKPIPAKPMAVAAGRAQPIARSPILAPVRAAPKPLATPKPTVEPELVGDSQAVPTFKGKTGSAKGMVMVGAIAGAFGVKGEVRLRAFTDKNEGVIAYGPLYGEDGKILLKPKSWRELKDGVAVVAPEIKTREEAEAMKGQKLFVPRANLPATAEDEFYVVDLLGSRAEALDGTVLGDIVAVWNFGAGDILEYKPPNGGPNVRITFTKETVPHVDLGARRVVIDPPAPEPVGK